MSAPATVPPKLFSCKSCRARKVKCDKALPECGPCIRATRDCVYPSRRPKGRRRDQQQQHQHQQHKQQQQQQRVSTRSDDFLERIQRVENIIGKAKLSASNNGPQGGKSGDVSRTGGSSSLAGTLEGSIQDSIVAAGASPGTLAKATIPSPPTQEHSPSASSPSLGAGAGAVNANKYISSDFWSILSAEMDGIKQALDQPSDSDSVLDTDEEDGAHDGQSPDSANTGMSTISSSLFSSSQHESEIKLPPHSEIVTLWNIYTTNVDPVFKVLHRPSVTHTITSLGNPPSGNSPLSTLRLGTQLSGHQPSPTTTALLACICYAAVASLSAEECERRLDIRQAATLPHYRAAAEKALAAANYLDSNELKSLQAFAIYVAILRSHDRSRNSWVLTGTLVRIATALRLHRDGDGSAFPPFEAEMRRRLWYSIITLDVRASEDRGSAALTAGMYNDTITPTSIDDEAFGPMQFGPLVPKVKGVPENIFGLCTARCAGLFGLLMHSQEKSSAQAVEHLQSEDDLLKAVRSLEQDFIHTADSSLPISLFAAELARCVILKLWLVINYPYRSQPIVSLPGVRLSRETTLRSALTVTESMGRMVQSTGISRFSWWMGTFVQWHPLAVALAELCVQTEGELVEYAWGVVERALPHSRIQVADQAGGPLWRPIRKLVKKARKAREEALARNRVGKGESLLEDTARSYLEDFSMKGVTSGNNANASADATAGVSTDGGLGVSSDISPWQSLDPAMAVQQSSQLGMDGTLNDASHMQFQNTNLTQLFEVPNNFGTAGSGWDNMGALSLGLEGQIDPWHDFLKDTAVDGEFEFEPMAEVEPLF